MRRAIFAMLTLAAPASAQTGLVPLPIGLDPAALSLDGRWVVGEYGSQAARWSITTGVQVLGPTEATAVSADGSVVVGRAPNNLFFRWSESTGQQIIGPGTPRALSADGSIVGGFQFVVNTTRAMAWSEATGVIMAPLPSSSGESSVMALSADGSIAAVSANIPSWQGYRWNIGGDLENLGAFPGGYNYVRTNAISADGEIIGGYGDATANWRAYVWTQGFGYVVLPGVYYCLVTGISADGRTVVGACRSGSDYFGRVWIGPGPQGPYSIHPSNAYLGARLQLPVGYVTLLSYGISSDGKQILVHGGVPVGPGVPPGPWYWLAQLCFADCDDNTILDVADFTCFLQRFTDTSTRSHQHQLYHWANCDKSTTAPVLNIADFACFLQKYAAGCP